MSGPREGGSYVLDPETGALTRNVAADAPAAEPVPPTEAPPAAAEDPGAADDAPPPSNRRKAAKE